MSNPLETGELFALELMNPNPSSSKTKDGPVYRVSFEMEQEAWQMFMDANTKGMILEFQGRVQAATPTEEPEKPKGGALAMDAAMLCGDPDVNAWAREAGFRDFKDMIYARCDVTSRAELDHDPHAAQYYDVLRRQVINELTYRRPTVETEPPF